MSVAPVNADRLEQVLESAAGFFEGTLWESDLASSVREYLASRGLAEATLRRFGVGYAPGDWRGTGEALSRAGFTPAELDAAGLVVESNQGHPHAQFRSRVMFPIRDPDGRIAGFAGMATNPGPSWPLWLTSPERNGFARGSALFGIDRAKAAIQRSGRALVLTDCTDVLLSHERDDGGAVAVIRSPVMRAHLERLAAVLGVPLEELRLDRDYEDRAGASGVLVARSDAGAAEGAAPVTPADVEPPRINPAARVSDDSIAPEPERALTTRGQVALWLVRAAFGIGIPLVWLAITGRSEDDPDGGSTAFVTAIGGVAVTYVVLAVAASLISARIRARSRARRMRTPWERGATEWQPPAWTYHLFEEVLVGAALVSVFTCMALFLTIGGFTN